jgi:hypothetical protein
MGENCFICEVVKNLIAIQRMIGLIRLVIVANVDDRSPGLVAIPNIYKYKYINIYSCYYMQWGKTAIPLCGIPITVI